jgi:hypothetical protein
MITTIIISLVVGLAGGTYLGYRWGAKGLNDVKAGLAAISTESTTLKSDVLAFKTKVLHL